MNIPDEEIGVSERDGYSYAKQTIANQGIEGAKYQLMGALRRNYWSDYWEGFKNAIVEHQAEAKK